MTRRRARSRWRWAVVNLVRVPVLALSQHMGLRGWFALKRDVVFTKLDGPLRKSTRVIGVLHDGS